MDYAWPRLDHAHHHRVHPIAGPAAPSRQQVWQPTVGRSAPVIEFLGQGSALR
ncbi:MAG: hypothetical protein KKC55_07900 [Gammaproteobacteria bacterium]|nr:hypothetical protein [Gammaproteobacteria bacterium]